MHCNGARIVSRLAYRTISRPAVAPRPLARPLHKAFSTSTSIQRDKRPPQPSDSRPVPLASYNDVKSITEAPTGATLLIEVVQGTIPSSVHLPMSELHDALKLDPDMFKGKYSFKKMKKDQDIILYCLAGVRSNEAAKEFRDEGYSHVRSYAGSWQEWQKRAAGSGRQQDSDDD